MKLIVLVLGYIYWNILKFHMQKTVDFRQTGLLLAYPHIFINKFEKISYTFLSQYLMVV